MLRFAQRPDAVFWDIIHEAIQSTIDDIEGFDFDPEAFQEQYEESSRVFTPQVACETLRHLLEASRSAQWYQPTDYHWLLLYDALDNYCALLNDGIEEYRAPAKYGIRRIDFDALLDSFFWDTDFLLSGNDVAGLGMEGRKKLAISPETFGLTQGLKPHPEELRLRAIDSDEDGETPPSDLYRPGSEVYPDMDLEP